jgi:TPR repeat protein
MRSVPGALVACCLAVGCRDNAKSAASSPRSEADEVALKGFATWEKPKKERDEAEAQVLFQDACDRGSQLGCAGLGTVFLSGSKNPEKAIELLTRACEAKVGRACASLAVAYESGLGVARDGAKAMSIARDACTAGEHRACVLYGRALLFGDHGVTRDANRCRELAEKACAANIAAGCTLAGLAYSTALNNAAEAQKWLDKGCKLGDGPGCAALAVQHFRGGLPGDAQGVAVSPERGVELATRACDLDAPIGCSLLAKALANGEGVAQDLRRARELAEKACSGSDAAGCSIAAQIAQAEGNIDSARKLLERSCRLGNSVACRKAQALE